MSPIVSAVDIACPPGEVFAYVTDPSRFGEWQAGVVSGHTDGEPAVGARFTTTRRIGGADRTSTSEITEINPPESWAIRGIDGPIRAAMQVSVEPRQNGEQSPRDLQPGLNRARLRQANTVQSGQPGADGSAA